MPTLTNATSGRTDLDDIRDYLVEALLDVHAIGGSDTPDLRDSAQRSLFAALTLLGGVRR